jgi:hypothetical protein
VRSEGFKELHFEEVIFPSSRQLFPYRIGEGLPGALHLRGMNMLYESMREKSSMVIVHSSAIESIGAGGALATVATAKGNKIQIVNERGFVMKKIAIALGCSLTFVAVPLVAQSTKTTPLGVWHGSLDGLPGVTLTLADDSGEIDGAVVFYAINGDPRCVFFIDPNLLLHPKLEGSTLSFQVKLGGDRTGPTTVKVVFKTYAKAQIRCLGCGSDSPTTELTEQIE